MKVHHDEDNGTYKKHTVMDTITDTPIMKVHLLENNRITCNELRS